MPIHVTIKNDDLRTGALIGVQAMHGLSGGFLCSGITKLAGGEGTQVLLHDSTQIIVHEVCQP